MKVSIAQTAYMPWCGLFERIKMSDLHICLDHVSLSGGEARNKIRTPNGFQELIVPLKSGQSRTPIIECDIAEDGKWRRKHLKALEVNYSRAPFFKEHAKFFTDFYSVPWSNFSYMCDDMREYLMEVFKITTPVFSSSVMDSRGAKSVLNLNLCKEVGATQFIVGPGTYSFLERALFEKAGIEVVLHDYKTPEYAQAWQGFEKNLSAVDALFNLGRLP